MFPALSAYERQLIKRDYREMVNGEGSTVQVKYRTPLLGGGSQPDVDPVYKTDRRQASSQLVTLPGGAKCIIRIVHDRDLKILGFGIVEAGDAIFYFLDSLNLLEPVSGKPALPQSLYFVDPLSGEWTPVLKEAGALVRYLAMIIGNEPIAQVIPCSLRTAASDS
jgi:hypothetical protein